MAPSVQDVKSSFKGTFLAADEEGYDISNWAENTQKPAKYVAKAACVEDISLAVKFARANGLELAIRGGGHNTSGSSATDGGVLVDLRKMNGVRVDEAAKVVYIQGGAVVKQVDEETIKYGLATTVGACAQVGVVGFAIGGGLSILSGEHGIGADNIVSATMVTADGDIVQVNENENPDLFWAIRGGGANFGVVAELGMRLHPQRKEIYKYNYVFVQTHLPGLVAAVQEWLKTRKPHQGFVMIMVLGPDGNPYVVFEGWSNSDSNDGEQCFKPIFDLGPVHSFHGPIPYETFSSGTDAFTGTPGNKLFVGSDIDTVDVPTVQKVYDAWFEITKSGASSSVIIYEFHSFEKMSKVPVEATAFAQRHANARVLSAICWPTSSKFTASDARDAALRLKQTISSSSSAELQAAIGYANHADVFASMNDTDNEARRVFGANYPRLQAVKAKWDPERVWNRWFAIQPAA